MKINRSDAALLSRYLWCCARHLHTGQCSQCDWEVNRLDYVRFHRQRLLNFIQKLSDQTSMRPSLAVNASTSVYHWPPSIFTLPRWLARSVRNVCCSTVALSASFCQASANLLVQFDRMACQCVRPPRHAAISLRMELSSLHGRCCWEAPFSFVKVNDDRWPTDEVTPALLSVFSGSRFSCDADDQSIRGPMENPTHAFLWHNMLCPNKDAIRVFLAIHEGVITEARYDGRTCVICGPCASMACKGVTGKLAQDALSLSPSELMDFDVEQLTFHQQECALVASKAIRWAITRGEIDSSFDTPIKLS